MDAELFLLTRSAREGGGLSVEQTRLETKAIPSEGWDVTCKELKILEDRLMGVFRLDPKDEGKKEPRWSLAAWSLKEGAFLWACPTD